MLGASRGAEDTWREATLGIPVDETNDPALLMYQAVLAHKSSLPTDKYLDRAAELYGELPSNVPLIRKLLAAGDDLDVDDFDFKGELKGVYARGRGVTYAVVAMLLGQRAPKQYVTNARTLLFASERPNF